MVVDDKVGGDYIRNSFDKGAGWGGMYEAMGVPRYFHSTLGVIGFAGVIVILLWFIFRGRFGGEWDRAGYDGEGRGRDGGNFRDVIIPLLMGPGFVWSRWYQSRCLQQICRRTRTR